MSGLRQQSIDCILVVKDDVEIALGRRGRTALARPLYPDGPEGLECVDETLLRDVPGDSTQEDLAAVERVVMLPGRELARPGTGGVIQTGGIAVELGCPVQAAGISGAHQEHRFDLLAV